MAALVILLVIRPIVNRIIETTMAASAAELATATADAHVFHRGGARQPAAVGIPGTAPASCWSGGGTEEESIDLSRVTGRVKSSSYNRLNELVEKHPDEALNVIRQWATKRP